MFFNSTEEINKLREKYRLLSKTKILLRRKTRPQKTKLLLRRKKTLSKFRFSRFKRFITMAVLESSNSRK